jgi:hypothetical protein
MFQVNSLPWVWLECRSPWITIRSSFVFRNEFAHAALSPWGRIQPGLTRR